MADGKGCVCHAYGECECACGADWTPQEVYDLRAKVAELNAEIERLRSYWDFLSDRFQAFNLKMDGNCSWHAKMHWPQLIGPTFEQAVQSAIKATEGARQCTS